LKYETVEKTKDGLVPKVIEREGPTGLIITTTAHKLHPENETRMLSLTVTDTREQTAAVFQALADDSRDDIDFRKWHALPEESQIYAAEEEPLQHCAAKSGDPNHARVSAGCQADKPPPAPISQDDEEPDIPDFLRAPSRCIECGASGKPGEDLLQTVESSSAPFWSHRQCASARAARLHGSNGGSSQF
jgi:hypothetical protein